MAGQAKSGKAFEYSLAVELYNQLQSLGKNVLLIENSSLEIARRYYLDFSTEIERQEAYRDASQVAIQQIISYEPRINNLDNFEIFLQEDGAGINGDVRDIVLQASNYEIGISAKNNHNALKHSRLSRRLNFGCEWFQISCSQNYFNTITPVFDSLAQYKQNRIRWSDINKEEEVYVPLLTAFQQELLQLNDEHDIVNSLIMYLIGRVDFYKVIKLDSNSTVRIYPFNLNNSLGDFDQVLLPTMLNSIEFHETKRNTLIATFDNNWQISFRIHNASTNVENSLKFDITLLSAHESLITLSLTWE